MKPTDAHYPREIAGGVFWVGGCQQRIRAGSETHGHSSAFLIKGTDKTLLVDTGHSAHWDVVEGGLDDALGGEPLDYVMPTHTEYPHAGNLQRLMRKFPGLQVLGDVRDYHLYYPDLFVTGRFHQRQVGDEVELGEERKFIFRPALLRDLPNTLWGYDTLTETVFVSDGFAYAHQHAAGYCRLVSSEYVPGPNQEWAIMSNETALWWPKYVDTDEYWPRFVSEFMKYPISLIAPAHGGVIDNPAEIMPMLRAVFIEMRKKGVKELADVLASLPGAEATRDGRR